MVWHLAEPDYKAKRISNWPIGGLRRDNRPAFSDYIPQRMRGMALNSGPQLRLNYYSAI